MEEVLKKLEVNKIHFDEGVVSQALELLRKETAEVGRDFETAVDEKLDIILPFHPDEDTVIAVILYDVYSYLDLSDRVLSELFGEEVLHILSAVKKLESLSYVKNDKSAQVDVLRKMIFAMARDVRVILIILTSRLFQMRHLEQNFISGDRPSYSKETLELYSPVASRLGIYGIKGELEDLAFKYTRSDEWAEISRQVEDLRNTCKLTIDFVKRKLEDFFDQNGIEARVYGRFKNKYSVYRKLKKKGLSSIDELYDLYAMRVVLPVVKEGDDRNSVDHLYSVLGLIHSEWKPLSKKFKDYISVPKPNGYRSLHTVILGIGPEGEDQPVEIQIRDEEMHRDAEFGIASHWIYKGGALEKRDIQAQIDWIKGLQQIRGDIISAENAGSANINLFNDRIFVLTPRGEVKDLPLGACPIDFAYAIHTDVGNRCLMAKVNGSVVGLEYELKNGDIVEIVTRRDITPKLQWLSAVKTGLARHKIKAWFGTMNREKNIKEGRHLINAQLERVGMPHLDQNYSLLKDYLNRNLSLSEREAIIEEVGKGSKIASDVVRKVIPHEKLFFESLKAGKRSKKKFSECVSLEENVLVGDEDGLPIKIAACCSPKMGDDILGYVTRGNRITIHALNCSLVKQLKPERIITAKWKIDEGDQRISVKLRVKGFSRIGLLGDVSSTISKLNVDVEDVSLTKDVGGFCEEHFTLLVEDIEDVDKVIASVEEVYGVTEVAKYT